MGAGPCLLIYLNLFGLYPADKNEGAPPSLLPSSPLPAKGRNDF
jgi:hypothetical protein